jgi:hypothetical protein
MLKYSAMLLLSVLTVGYVGKELAFSMDGSLNWLDVLANQQRVDDQMVRQKLFRDVLDTTLHSLASGKISLKDASSRVHDAAETYCPAYFGWVTVSDPGRTMHERIARNLLGHLDEPDWRERVSSLHLQELATQLQNLLAVEQTSSMVSKL